MQYRSPHLSLRVLALTLVLSAFAEGAELLPQETAFIRDSLEASMAVYKVSEVAHPKTTRPEVREFAKKLVEHHATGTAELKQLAAAKAVKYEDALSLPHTTAVAKFDRLSSGESFDRELVSQLVAEHEKMVRDLEGATHTAQDADVKALVEKMLPSMRAHLQTAKALQKRS